MHDVTGLFLQLNGDVAAGRDLASVYALAARTAGAASQAEDVWVVANDAASAHTLAVRTCLHGQPARCPGDEQAVLTAAVAALRQHAPSFARPLSAVPFYAGDRPLGALVLAGDPERLVKAAPWLLGVADLLSLGLQAESAVIDQQRRVREFALLDEVAGDCAELELDRLLPSVTSRIGEALGASVTTLWFASTGRDELVLGAVAHPPNTMAPRLRSRIAAQGFARKAVLGRQPRRGLVEDLGLPDLEQVGQALELPSSAAVPLVVRDRAVGLMTLLGATPFSDDDLRLASALCTQVAVAVDNARLLGEASRRASELATVQSVAEVLTRSLDPDELVDHAIDRLCAVLECDVGRVYLLERGAFQAIHDHGLTEEQHERSLRVPADEPLITDALASGVAIERRAVGVEEPTRTFLREIGLPRVAAAPLRLVRPGAPDAPGVVLLGRRFDRPFASEDLRVLSAVTSQLSVALQNAWLFEETRRRMEELAVVIDAGGVLARPYSQREALDVVARRVAALMKVRDCTIYIVDETGRLLRPRGGSRAALVDDRPGLPLEGDSLCAQAARSQAPCHGPATEADLMAGDESAPNAFLTAVPLVSGDTTVAVFLLSDPRPLQRVSAPSLDRLLAVSSQVAISIERTRLFHALERSLDELAHTQRELVKKERLAALGEMAALVAHEIRNPLGVIFSALAALGRLVPPDGDAQTAFRILREEADRLNRIVSDMLDYTRPLRPSVVPTDLARIVQDAVSSALASERRRGTSVDEIDVTCEVAAPVPEVRVDEQLIHQAVVNLLSNAMQSTGPGGHVRVRLSTHDTDAGLYARIEVEDDGPGFSAEARARLFEPFVTTKATGSGLGLAVVQRVMDAHDGLISLVDRDGGGTIFRLDLPSRPLPPTPARS